MLDPKEWLKDAKRVAIGGSNRVYHGAERRPNLVVRNLPDKYTAYCHACHEGGVVMKELVKVQDTPPVVVNRKRDDPGQLYSIDVQTPNPNVPIKDIVRFLHDKDMSLHTLAALHPMWSPQDQRIVFITPDQVVGRDITGRSPSKWYTYKSANSYNRAKPISFNGEHVVLTEDYFSAAKGQHYCADRLFVGLMGTTMYSDLTVALCDAAHVTVLLDCDDAGRTAAPTISRTLNLLDIPHTVLFPHEGCDPKNMDHNWWWATFPERNSDANTSRLEVST